MTQYFDKHGTEIRHGDVCQWDSGMKTTHTGFAGMFRPDVYEQCAVVLSRANGTRIPRYDCGRDVREGDIFRALKGKEVVVTARMLDLAITWEGCTFLRRANSPREISSTASVDDRPILGKDRNGREVRRGDRVSTMSGRAIVVREVRFVGDKTYPQAVFHDGSNHLDPAVWCELAELVTDEKAEQCTCGGDPFGHNRTCPIVADTVKRFEDEDRELSSQLDALESLCRALGGPTRAERIAENYRKFHRAVTDEVAREPSFSVVTDRSDVELMAFITAPLVGERRCAVPSGTALNYSAIAFEWLAALRRMVAEKAGARVLGKGEA